MRSSLLALVLVCGVTVVATYGCGNSNPPVCVGDCECTADSCTCAAGGNCTINGGADGGDLAALPSNQTITCEKDSTCNVACGTGCDSNCASNTTCVGACSSGCTSSCSANSTCDQNIGDNSTASCTGGSDCDITTGANSTVECAGGSDCRVTLSVSSTLECTGTSICKVACADGGCTVKCGGDALCACLTPDCKLECSNIQTEQTCNGKQACVKNNNCPTLPDGGVF